MSLETWLGLGKKVPIGPKEFVLMPLPLKKMREAGEKFQEHVEESLKGLLDSQSQKPDVTQFIIGILETIDVSDLVYWVLTAVKDLDSGKPLNNELTKEYLEEHLDAPTLRLLVEKFIEVNQAEEILKNLQSLPGMSRVWEGLTSTFGIALLSSLPMSMASPPGTSGNSQSPRSEDTLRPEISGSNENLKKQESSQILQ